LRQRAGGGIQTIGGGQSRTAEDRKVTLMFSGDETPVEAGTNEWDEALKHRGKH